MLASLKTLLESSNKVIEEQKKAIKSSGENFNIFSILNLETREDATHSAFIGELLNPNGSHLMGTVFLKLFLETIGFESFFDIKSAKLTKEFYISKVNLEQKTGGRVDLYLRDNNGNSISIENKIYAIDQDYQIERYVNHNTSNNIVYYLTLNGEEPSPISKGPLLSGKDFHRLSYVQDIINWLKKCQQKVDNTPIIKESIHQYIVLIKKLTHQLSDDKMQEEILDLISHNYETALLIEENIKEAEKRAAIKLFEMIKKKIESKVGSNWYVDFDENALSLTPGNQEDYWIILEGNKNIYRNHIYFGVYGDNVKGLKLIDGIHKNEYFKDFEYEKGWGPWKYISGMDFYNNPQNRAKLFNSDDLEILADKCVKHVLELKNVLEKVT